jgi:hypothetical protein
MQFKSAGTSKLVANARRDADLIDLGCRLVTIKETIWMKP